MTDVDIRGLFRIRERITRLRSRSWTERLKITSTIGVSVLLITTKAASRGILVVAYTPFAVVARLLQLRFPNSHALSRNFGHLAVDPGLYVQSQAIGERPTRKAVLVISRNSVHNLYLLNLWRQKFHVISHPLLSILLTPLKWSKLSGSPMYQLDYKIVSELGDKLISGPAVDEIANRYAEVVAGKPLLTLDDITYQSGLQLLQENGMPNDAWWVAFHAREASYHGAGYSPRNVDPHTYIDAIHEIIGRGGYVVRIGDSGMTPLPDIDGLIDLSRLEDKLDWIDIFVIAGARFLLESNSGPGSIAWICGVPVAATNWVPICQGTMSNRDIRIPKLMVESSSSKVLSFDTVLGSEFLRDIHNKPGAAQAGIHWRDNTAEEIRELAIEMMDRLDGIANNEPRDNQLQSRFQNLVESKSTPETLGTMSRIGRHFLREHAGMFEEEAAQKLRTSAKSLV
jgi:putative glycosyltransferase (TIGR04372 family)